MCDSRMNNRVALITGGGTGIGAAVAQLFACEGAKVVIAGRREEPLKAVVEEIQAAGGSAAYCCADVTKIDDSKRMVDKVHEQFGLLDALVNNAGVVSRLEDPRTMTDAEWEWQMNINVRGVFHTTKFALPDMIEKGGGTIVTTASMSAYMASPGYATYSASKAALIAYTKVLAMQFADKGIRANTVSPGIVHTPMAYVDRDDFLGMLPRLDALHPLGRVGTPEDIAYAILFLSCHESAWITGQDLIIDGGLSVKG